MIMTYQIKIHVMGNEVNIKPLYRIRAFELRRGVQHAFVGSTSFLKVSYSKES